MNHSVISLQMRVLPGAGVEAQQPMPMYVREVVDEMGGAHARRTYWDFGNWAVLWRSWRPIDEEPATFQVLIQSGTDLGSPGSL